MNFLKAVLSTSFFAFSVSAFADSSLNEATYSIYEDGLAVTTNAASNGVSFNLNGVPIKIGITGWSDTGGSNDDKLESGSIQAYYNCTLGKNGCTTANRKVGYGLQNTESGDGHALDNFTGGNDFDMFLFSFSEAVSLKSAGFSYISGSNGNSEVTIAGLSDISMFSDSNTTWSDVTGNIIAGALGHFGIDRTKNDSGLYESSFGNDFTQTAKYWLVGAYNTVFDGNNSTHHGVGLKLSSLDISIQNTQQNTEVSEPGALALMSLGLGLVLYRRKRRA
jgi:hypothetical protein